MRTKFRFLLRRKKTKLALLFCVLTTVFVLLVDFSSFSPTIRSYLPTGNVFVCDSYLSLKCPLAKEFAMLLFPDRNITDYRGQNTSKQDILIVVCGCSHAQWFKGIILYGDNGHGILHLPGVSQKKVVYAGVKFPVSNEIILKQVDMFFSALVFSLVFKNVHSNSLQQRKLLKNKRSFLIYHSIYCADFEIRAFNTLIRVAKMNGFKIPVNTGNCSLMNNNRLDETEFVFSNHGNIIDTMSKFRFALVMERTNIEGYVTERILNAFLGGTIPIYYGTTDVFKLFNSNSFIYYDILNPQKAIDKIIYLETNNEAYQTMINQPILANGEHTIREYLSLTDNIGGGLLKHTIVNTVGLAQSTFMLEQPIRYRQFNRSKLNVITSDIKTDRTFIPFYMYYDTEFTEILHNCKANERPDKMLLKLYRKHPWRTYVPAEAKVFIIPIPLLDSFRCDRKGHNKRLERSLNEISSTIYFKRYNGRDHLLMAHAWQLSVWTWKRIIAPDHWWDKISEVTATRFEYFGMSKWENSLSYERAIRVPKQMFAMQWEPTKRSIVVPYETPPGLDIVSHNYTEWQTRPNLIWYHAKPTSFLFGATRLRQLPILQRHLFPGEIGFDISANEWLSGWSKSKFCFVMRGDTPTSHAFYNAIASSCIPVVISDNFELVGLPFKHIIPLNAIAIIFQENEFLKNPESCVQSLKLLSKKDIQNILLNIKIIHSILAIRNEKTILPELILQETSNYIDNIFNMHSHNTEMNFRL